MRNPKRKTLLSRTDDIVRPTPERLAMIGDGFDNVTETVSRNQVRATGAVRVWSSLEHLYRNHAISEAEYDAGEQFYRDWFLGFHASEQTTMQWSEYIPGSGGSGDLDAAERRTFHARRFARANARLDEIGVRKLVHWVVINGLNAEQVGRRWRGYRTRHKAAASGATAVSMALGVLAKFYGLARK